MLNLPFSWEQGEHMAIIGDTGSGKSTLAAQLLDDRWPFFVVTRTKADDVRYSGAKVIREAKRIDNNHSARFVLDPPYEQQSFQLAQLFDRVWEHGGWTVYIDETFYAINVLRLERWINRLLTQGRSMGITVVTGMQRPVMVSRFAISQAKHVICFSQEGRDAKTLAEATSPSLAATVADLGRHEFVWWYRPTREQWRGRLQDLGGKL